MSIRQETLDWWFTTNKNVMLIGKHGVGKTAMIKSCFERNGLIHNETYLYFSASTLDPWVDLIGCPKEVLDENGNKYLDIIRPKNLYKGKIVAIFFDEFNRSPKKVRNAVMELLQFKSINGFKFPDLKCVWTAINPEEDDNYDVEKIDPAQQDRFHIIKEIPYACDKEFFINKFGDSNAIAAIEWWDALPENERNLVSPRRLEYALDEFCINGNVRDILPVSTNVSKLLNSLKAGSIQSKIKFLYETKNVADTKLFLSDENNINSAINYITENEEYLQFFLPFITKEKVVSFLSSSDVVFNHVAKEYKNNESYFNILKEILMGANKDLKRKVTAVFSKQQKELIEGMEEKKEKSSKEEAEIFDALSVTPTMALEDVIKNLQTVDFGIIEIKAVGLKLLAENFPYEINTKDCYFLMSFISRIINTSSKNTLLSKDFKNVIPMLNALAVSLSLSTATYIDDLWNLKENNLMISKLKEYGLFDKVIKGGYFVETEYTKE